MMRHSPRHGRVTARYACVTGSSVVLRIDSLELRRDEPARMDAELGEDVLDVVPHGVRADVELVRDLPVRGASREQSCHLRFARGQSEVAEREWLRRLLIAREANVHRQLERWKQ